MRWRAGLLFTRTLISYKKGLTKASKYSIKANTKSSIWPGKTLTLQAGDQPTMQHLFREHLKFLMNKELNISRQCATDAMKNKCLLGCSNEENQ